MGIRQAPRDRRGTAAAAPAARHRSSTAGESAVRPGCGRWRHRTPILASGPSIVAPDGRSPRRVDAVIGHNGRLRIHNRGSVPASATTRPTSAPRRPRPTSPIGAPAIAAGAVRCAQEPARRPPRAHKRRLGVLPAALPTTLCRLPRRARHGRLQTTCITWESASRAPGRQPPQPPRAQEPTGRSLRVRTRPTRRLPRCYGRRAVACARLRAAEPSPRPERLEDAESSLPHGSGDAELSVVRSVRRRALPPARRPGRSVVGAEPRSATTGDWRPRPRLAQLPSLRWPPAVRWCWLGGLGLCRRADSASSGCAEGPTRRPLAGAPRWDERIFIPFGGLCRLPGKRPVWEPAAARPRLPGVRRAGPRPASATQPASSSSSK
jgi:hypothetical protein